MKLLITGIGGFVGSTLAELKMNTRDDAFTPDPDQAFPHGMTPAGVGETYTTLPPVSLYGSTKVTSEHLALEYGSTFDFPAWGNRCGVMASASQFEHPAQGIFAYWIHAFRENQPLKYIGFSGHGHQVRDCLHPNDLVPLLQRQFAEPLTTHHSPLTTHHSPLTTHHSPLTTHHSPLTTHHSPLTTHQAANRQRQRRHRQPHAPGPTHPLVPIPTPPTPPPNTPNSQTPRLPTPNSQLPDSQTPLSPLPSPN